MRTILYFAKAYFTSLCIFICIDLLWLGYIARPLYDGALHQFLSTDVNWIAVGFFYLLYSAGLVVFAIRPNQLIYPVTHALGYGALYGLATYGTYDLTNYATLNNWPLWIVIVDMTWGSLLSAVTASLTTNIMRK